MASVLGGDVGRTGHICGAVSGAALVIGMKFGSTDNTNIHSRNKAYQKANELLEKFSAPNKSVLCKELLGYDIKTKERLKQARETGIMAQNACWLFYQQRRYWRALSVPSDYFLRTKINHFFL